MNRLRIKVLKPPVARGPTSHEKDIKRYVSMFNSNYRSKRTNGELLIDPAMVLALRQQKFFNFLTDEWSEEFSNVSVHRTRASNERILIKKSNPTGNNAVKKNAAFQFVVFVPHVNPEYCLFSVLLGTNFLNYNVVVSAELNLAKNIGLLRRMYPDIYLKYIRLRRVHHKKLYISHIKE